ncbi:hypothetical protein HF086_002124 [Spodoptera exigua]|uniref:Adenylate cyclase n=1 Tax=Spodoptera exigua TaxID=7107 RepID=A0A922MN23_SPOEX|nr:hypothetical protein HF086_002124 [Spodoptera exigua]
MNEGTVDIQSELEKLRRPSYREPLPENEEIKESKTSPSQETDDPQKYRLILEPALVGAMIAINLGQTSLQNFYLQTACTVDLGVDLEVCLKGDMEAESQVVVSGVNVSRSFIGSLISTIILLFVGPWSDCSGRRKPLLILPLIGMSVMTTGVILMLIFPGASTVQVLYAVQLPISLGGNFGLLLAAAFSHIGDLCFATGRDVTRTMGTHRAAVQIAHVLGAVGGPLLYRTFGFFGVFPLVLFLQVSSLIYVIVAVKDVNVNRDNKVSVCNWKLPFNAVYCLVKPREGRKRTIIFLMLVVTLGDRMLLSGTLLILSILKRRLRLSDEMVGMLSCASYILATSGLIAATMTWCVFMLPLVGIIAQGSQVVQRPLLNKQILPTEQGKIYSVMGSLESAMQTMSSPLYSLLYTKTVATMPDAWLLPGIGLAFIQLFSYLITRKLRQSVDLKTNPTDLAETEKNPETKIPLRTKEVK